jgi:hypothetical protein
MTTPQQPAPPFDPGNQLLGEQPAQCTTALIPTAVGQRLALTIRTPSATLTVFLGKDDAITWAGNLRNTAKQMSGSGLIVAAPGNGIPVKEQG